MATHYANGKTTTSGLVFMYDTIDKENCYKGEPTTNYQIGYDPWTVGGINTDVTNTIDQGPIKNAKTWKFEKTGGSYQWNGWEATYVGIWTGNSGDIWTTSYWYKTTAPAGVTGFGVGAFYLSDWSRPYNTTFLGGSTSIIADGQWHYGWATTQFNENYSNAIIVDGPSWGYSPQTGTLYINGLQWEKKSHPTPFAGYTRSATQGLLDVVGTNQINISNVSFDANAQIVFDGTNDYINVPYNTSHNLTTQGTISVWINPASLTQGSYAGLVSQSTGGSANSQAYQLSWRQVSGGLFGSICNGSGTYNDVLASFPSTANAWYNIVFTWNGSLLSIYNNGVLSAQSAQTIVNQVLTTDLTIGGYTYKGAGGVDEYFNGSINNVELFNRGFTAQEVLQNYNTKKSRFNLK
jgi:hypothetical protein